MINDISTLKKAMKARRRIIQNKSPLFDFDRYYTDNFRNTFCKHIEQAFNMADFNKWTYEGTVLYTRSTKYVSTVSTFKDEDAGYTYLYIRTPKSKELINLNLVYKDMLELKEIDTDAYLKVLELSYKGE